MKAGGKVEIHSLPSPPLPYSNFSVKPSLGSGRVSGCDRDVRVWGPFVGARGFGFETPTILQIAKHHHPPNQPLLHSRVAGSHVRASPCALVDEDPP